METNEELPFSYLDYRAESHNYAFYRYFYALNLPGIIIDREHTIKGTNKSFCRLFSHSPDFFWKNDLRKIIPFYEENSLINEMPLEFGRATVVLCNLQGILSGLQQLKTINGIWEYHLKSDHIFFYPLDEDGFWQLPLAKSNSRFNPKDYALLKRNFLKGKDFSLVVRLKAHASSYQKIFLDFIAFPQTDTCLFRGISVNVSQLLEGHHLLKQKEKLFTALFRNLPEGLFIYNATSGKIIYHNKWLTKMLGYHATEFFHLSTWEKLIHPADRLIYEEHQKKRGSPKAGETLQTCLRISHQNGSYLYCYLLQQVFQRKEGQQIILNFVRDITPQKEAERAAGLAQERYKQLFEQFKSPIMLFAKDGSVRLANNAAKHFFDLQNDEQAIAKTAQEKIEPIVRKVLGEHKETSLETEFSISGSKRLLQASFEPLPSLEKEPDLVQMIGYDITQTRFMPTILAHSAQLLRAVLDTFPGSVQITDLDYNILEISRFALQDTHYSYEEAIGEKCYKIFYNRRIPCKACPLPEIIKRDDFFTKISNTAEEKRKGYAYKLYSIPLKDKKIWGVLQGILDISDLKTMQNALAKSEERYRLLAENSKDVIWTCDEEKKFTYVSPSLTKMSGYAYREVLGLPLENFIEENSVPRFRQLIKNLEYVGGSGVVEVEFVKKDNSFYWVEISLNFLRDDTGKIIGYSGINRDITERKNFREELLMARDFAQNVIETALDVIITTDRKNFINIFNHAAEATFGYKREEILGKHIGIIYPRQTEILHIAKAIKKQGKFSGEVKNIRKNQEIFVSQLSATVLQDINNENIGMVINLKDITELKKKELEIATSLREKEVLLKEIHHRVKNNLQIMSSLLALQSNQLTDQYAISAFNESQNRIRTIALIHEKLYQSSSFSRIDFSQYIREIVNYLSFAFKVDKQKCKINIKVTENLFLDIDTAIPCALIINEIISNAFKYAFNEQKKGEIDITLSYTDSYQLIVRDNGRGFCLNANSRKSLGLKLIEMLVTQLDGTLSCQTECGVCYKIVFGAEKKNLGNSEIL